jgi:NitT/TauT family transport system substrate-binding protein
MRTGTVHRVVALAGALALLVVAAACGDDDDGAETTGDAPGAGDDGGGELTHIEIGVVPVVDVAPLYLGIEEGFFEEEGLDVEPVVAQGGAAIIPSVVRGDQPIGFSNIVSLLIAETEDLPIQVISQGVQATDDPENDTAAVAVAGDSDIREVADLEGRTIAVNTLRNISPLTITAALDAEGVDPSTLEFVEVPLPDMVGQLDAGDVDAAGLVEPFVTIGENAGDRMLVYDRVATEPEMTVANYFTSSQYLESDPEVVEGFVRAMNRSLEYATDNPEEARQAIGQYTEIEPDVLEQVVLPLWQEDLNRDSIEHTAELMVEQGITEDRADVDALIADLEGGG